MTRRRDVHTPDLFGDFTPPTVVERFLPERIRAASPAARVKRIVSEAIRDFGRSRGEIAKAMTDYLGESVTPAMLDQYTSTANEGHNIPAYRLAALLAVTGDVRIANALLADTN